MTILNATKRITGRILETITILLMIILTIVVILAVLARLSGNSFSWYDEVAAILLAWITYYGSALAAIHRRHIGFDSVLLALPANLRLGALILGELLVASFFILMAWAGFRILEVLEGDRLVSLTWVPVQFTQSVIPIGAMLFVFCQILSLPEYWKRTRMGVSLEHMEIDREIELETKKLEGRT